MTEGRLDNFRETMREIVNIKNGIIPEDAQEDDFLETPETSVVRSIENHEMSMVSLNASVADRGNVSSRRKFSHVDLKN